LGGWLSASDGPILAFRQGERKGQRRGRPAEPRELPPKGSPLGEAVRGLLRAATVFGLALALACDMKSLLILGSTGSIGTQTLELVRASQGRLRVAGLAAGRQAQLLADQAAEFRPRFVALADPDAAADLPRRLPAGTTLLSGPGAVEELIAAAEYDVCVHGMVGAAGLGPSEAVLRRGKSLALANKESLVMAGAALMELARRTGAALLPVDSEHAALFQCLGGLEARGVRRLLLTASGGPLRDRPLADFPHITPQEALAHPNWNMGPRITVGSATLMNKALEVIEAQHLFGVRGDQIEVVIHRQSIVHSLVEFVDGSVMAQLGPPDMRLPIHAALYHPERVPNQLRGFDLKAFRELTFEAPDPARFPALELGYRCLASGGDAGAVLNAADEVSVAAFLAGQLPFNAIAEVNRAVLEAPRPPSSASVQGALESDRAARLLALRLVAERTRLAAGAGPGGARSTR
jgi:1-deoxy-D-xylulose-5-phosphate reductoisomerase